MTKVLRVVVALPLIVVLALYGMWEIVRFQDFDKSKAMESRDGYYY